MASSQRLVVFSLVAVFFVVIGYKYGQFSIAEIRQDTKQSLELLESTGIPQFSAHSVRIYIGVVSTLIERDMLIFVRLQHGGNFRKD
jgi:hypothetical protein